MNTFTLEVMRQRYTDPVQQCSQVYPHRIMSLGTVDPYTICSSSLGNREETHPKKRGTTKSNTVDTSHTLTIETNDFLLFWTNINRELKGIHICGCQWNERLKDKTDGSTCLTYTGLCGEPEHLKIETRLIGESFECVMGECVIEVWRELRVTKVEGEFH